MADFPLNVWLSVPQAVFLLVTGDLKRAREFNEHDPHFLVFLVARTLSSECVSVPLDPSAGEPQRLEARKEIKQKLSAEIPKDIYGAGVKALCQIIGDGIVRAKGSRSLDGPVEQIDPVEFTRVNLRILHAVNAFTKAVVWYHLRISARDLIILRQLVQSGGAAPADTLSGFINHNGPSRPQRDTHPKWQGARDAAMEWLSDNGCPARRDGNQAELERHITTWLDKRGYDAGESSIRRHVAGWIKERREELGCLQKDH
jgi:hypothetical protein